jgi:transcriptional regulator with XRE-family HTH domain
LQPSPRLLVAARTLVGLGQEELAERAGISASALRRLERGETSARSSTVDAITRALLALGVEFLLDPTGEKEGIQWRRR